MSSQVVDNRIVEMQFDNKDFEKNVATSLTTLDKLKASLNLGESARGLDRLSESARRFSMGGMSAAVETVTNKFSAMEVVAITALANITNSAVNAGKSLLKSLTVDQISAGWTKFGNKTQSVGTLIAQGYDLDTVTEQLDRLNWYTDETSYNFTDMVENISKFTAAGQDLDTSVTAMEGIANWAALSGQNATVASRAMYQLSQAMGKGALKLDDFKSIQNASMDTREFRQHCLDAAVALGTLKKTGEDTYAVIGNEKHEFDINRFTERLSDDAWLTSDVMMKVFQEYSAAVDEIYEYSEAHGLTANQAIKELGDKLDEFGRKAFEAGQEARTFEDVVSSVQDAVSTSLMRTFQIVFGNYEEATELWTAMANGLYDVFAEPINEFNIFLKGAFSLPKRTLNAKDLFNLNLNETQMTAFQKLLAETARKHNIEIDKMIEEEGSFNATIKNGWLDGKIFDDAIKSISTLSTKSVGDLEKIRKAAVNVIRGDYGNDMGKRFAKLAAEGLDPELVQNYVNVLHKLTNGTWDLSDAIFEAADAQLGSAEGLASMSDAELEAIGYTKEEISVLRDLAEQAKETGTPINDLYSSLLYDMTKKSGRTLLIESVTNALEALGAVIGTIQEAWADIFPAATSEQLYEFLEKMHSFSETLAPSEDTLAKLKSAFSGLFSVLDIGLQIGGAIVEVFGPIVQTVFSAAGGAILNVAAYLGNWITSLRSSLKESNVFVNFLAPFGERITHFGEKIWDNITAFIAWAKENDLVGRAFEFVSNKFQEGIKLVTDWIGKIRELPIVNKAFEKITKVVTRLVDAFRSLFGFDGVEFGSFKDILANFTFDDLKEKFSQGFRNLKTYFTSGTAVSDLKEAFSGITDYFSGKDFGEGVTNSLGTIKVAILDFAENAKKNLEDAGFDFEGIKEKLEKFVTGVQDMFSNANWGPIIAMIGVLVGLVIIKKIAGIIANITSLGGLLTSVNNYINAMAKERKAAAFKERMKGILMIAGAIGILVAAVVILGKQDLPTLAKGVGGLVIVSAVLAGLILMAAKLGDSSRKVQRVAYAALAMAGAVAILVLAIKMLETVKIDLDLAAHLGLLVVLIGGLVLAMKKLGDTKGGGKDQALSFLGLAAGVLILVKALSDIQKLDMDKLLGSVIILGAVLAELAGAMRLAGEHGKGNGLGFLAMAASVVILIQAIKMIGKLDPESALAGIGVITLLLIELTAVMVILNKTSTEAVKVGVGIVAIAAACLLLTGVVAIIGSMDSVTAFKGVIGTMLLVLAVGVLLSSLGTVSNDAIKAGIAVLIIAGAIAALSLLVTHLGEMDTGDLAKGLIAVGVLTLLIIGIIKACKELTSNVGTFIALAVTVGILTVALVALSNIDGEQLLKTAGSLALVLAALALLTVSTKFSGEPVKVLVSMAAGLIALAGVTAALYVLKDFDGEDILAKAEGLALVIGVIGGVCAAMSALKVNVASAAMAALGFGAFVVVLGAIVAALGELNDFFGNGIVESIEKGLPVLEKIGEAIGAFFGGIVAGFQTAKASGLEEVGTSLSNFATNAQGFFDLASGLSPDAVDNVGIITKSILTITEGELLDAIASFLTKGKSNLQTFSEDISVLGDALSSYMTVINEAQIDGDKIQAAEDIASFFSSLKGINIDTTGGLLGWLKETGDLSGFAEDLPALGQALMTYSMYADAVDASPEQIKKSEDIANFLASLSGNNIHTEGGIFEFVQNKNALTEFSEQLPQFGQDLLDVSEKFKEITVEQDNIDKAKKIAEFLSALGANEAIQTGGLMEVITGGSIDLETFGNQLGPFGEGVTAYATAIQTLPTGEEFDAIQEKSEDLAHFLATFATTDIGGLKNSGLLGILSGNQISLSKFAEQLQPFGEGITKYAESLGDSVTSEKVDIANNAVGILSSFNQEIDSDAITRFSSFGIEISSFGVKLSDFVSKTGDLVPGDLDNWGTSIANMAKSLNEIPTLDESKASAFGSFLDGLPDKKKLTKLSGLDDDQKATITNNVNGWLESFSASIGSDTSLSSSMTDLANNMIAALSEKGQEFEDAGKDLMQSLKNGVNDTEATTSMTTSLGNLVENVLAPAITDKGDKLSDAGVTLMKKLTSGMQEQSEKKGTTKSVKEAVKAITSAVDGKKADVKKSGTELAGQLVTGLESKNQSIKTIFTKPLGDAIAAVIGYIQQFYNQGSNISTALKNGLSTANTVISTAFNIPLNSAVEAARSYYGSFSSVGAYLVQGFAGGITLKTYVARQAAAAMANAAKDSANKTLGVSSPSKVFYQIGSYTGQGFVNALYDYGSNAYVAGADIADNARRGLSGAIGKVSDVIENGMDSEPTIRPVLDLSNVQDGMDVISGMFSGGTQLSMMANARAISSGMAGSASGNQNEVISAIDRLGTQLATASGPSYTINGITYENGSTVANAIETLVQAVIVNKRS